MFVVAQYIRNLLICRYIKDLCKSKYSLLIVFEYCVADEESEI